jgi:hypothetical protein
MTARSCLPGDQRQRVVEVVLTPARGSKAIWRNLRRNLLISVTYTCLGQLSGSYQA